MLLTDRLLAVTFAVSIGLLGVGGYNQRVEKCTNWHAPLEYPEYCEGILEREANEESYREFPATLKQVTDVSWFHGLDGSFAAYFTNEVQYGMNYVTYDYGVREVIELLPNGQFRSQPSDTETGVNYDAIEGRWELASDGQIILLLNNYERVVFPAGSLSY